MHTKLVEQFYQELRDRNPEWEIRKQEVLKVPMFHHLEQHSHMTALVAQRDAREETVFRATLHPLATFYGRILIYLFRGFAYFGSVVLYCLMVVPLIHFYTLPLKLCPIRFI